MIPNDIAYIIGKPGRYAISADPALRLFTLIEADAQGQIHQLDKDGKRDGVLSRDGWATPDVKVFNILENGDFVRLGVERRPVC